MISQHILPRIDEARAAVSGEHSSVSRVIDTLLDLRLLAADRADVVDQIDAMIAAIPGDTVTPNDWWIHQLDFLEIQLTDSGQDDGNREPLAAGY